jgi:cellulose biosynthesis protein BcsQ
LLITGGVGKTLSCLYTGRWLARAGFDVTLVDRDPQRGLLDIATALGCPDGRFTKRLRLSLDDALPIGRPAAWTLVDTQPALDGSLPVLAEADYLVIPVIPEIQEVAALEKFLSLLDGTRRERPYLHTLGILPVRYVHYWANNRACLQTIRHLGERYGYPVLDPVPWPQAVSRYRVAKGLWKHVADALIAKEPALLASSTTGKAVAHAALRRAPVRLEPPHSAVGICFGSG